MSIDIRNGDIVTPNSTISDGRILIGDTSIEAISQKSPRWKRSSDTIIDATGCLVVPGLIDIHGDDIERHLFPRAGASIDPTSALVSADRANIASGITTKFHAIAFEDSPSDNRSIDLANRVVDLINEGSDTLVDNRAHARCELGSSSVQSVIYLIDTQSVDLVSVMHHEPGSGQFADEHAFARRYLDGYDVSKTEAEAFAERRSQMPRGLIDNQARRVVEAAVASDIPVASHDDESPALIDDLAAYGVTISEFPITLEAAKHATKRGLWTAMGASNLLNGGSLWDNLDAVDAIGEGVVDILCSDYHPPSMLAACFVDTDEPLHERLARVTTYPARAVGLSDRGRLIEGARSDVIVVDPENVPTVKYAIIDGELVYQAGRRPSADTTVETSSVRRAASR